MESSVRGQAIDKRTLVEMLSQASELEQSLCLQYLYAVFTLKVAGEGELTSSQASLTQQWSQQITRVAVQEMYHLLLASNLVTAVGAVPSFDRPRRFPQSATRYSKIDIPSMLAPFDAETASRFMCWEKPEDVGWWDKFCQDCGDRARTRLGVTKPQDIPPYGTIGELYGLIKQALLEHPDWIDPATANSQVTSAIVPFKPTVAPITNAADAAHYIDIIVSEGEGTPNWESNCHFAYFHQVVNQLEQLDQSDSGFIMAWPTVDNPIYHSGNWQPGASLIDDPKVRLVGDLFNELYLLLVRVLTRLFSPTDETPGERQSLANAATAVMPLGIEPLGMVLTRLPAGVRYPGRYAGPSFELPQRVERPSGAKAETFSLLHDSMVKIVERLRVLSTSEIGFGTDILHRLDVIAADLETLLPLFPAKQQTMGARS